MRHPLVLVHERDGRLFHLLRDLWEKNKWAVRKVARAENCLAQACTATPTVLVIRLSARPEQELNLLDQASWQNPDLLAVVVGDEAQAGLASVAWDLGAAFFLSGPQLSAQLQPVVRGLMNLAIERRRIAVGQIPAAAPATE